MCFFRILERCRLVAEKIKIVTEQCGKFIALLNDDCPNTTNAILDALPFEARAQTWGDEIYFSIPVSVAEENAHAVVELGDLGYWPPGAAFCIFFGKTPTSRSDDEIRPASPVNVFGKLEEINSDIIVKLRRVVDGETIRIEKLE